MASTSPGVVKAAPLPAETPVHDEYQAAVRDALAKGGWKITVDEPYQLRATRPYHAGAILHPVLIRGYSVLAVTFRPTSGAKTEYSFAVEEHRYGYIVSKTGKTTKGWALVAPDHGTINEVSASIAAANRRFVREHPAQDGR